MMGGTTFCVVYGMIFFVWHSRPLAGRGAVLLIYNFIVDTKKIKLIIYQIYQLKSGMIHIIRTTHATGVGPDPTSYQLFGEAKQVID